MASAALHPLRCRSHRFCGSRRVFVTDAFFGQGKSLVSFVLQVRSGKKGLLGSGVLQFLCLFDLSQAESGQLCDQIRFGAVFEHGPDK